MREQKATSKKIFEHSFPALRMTQYKLYAQELLYSARYWCHNGVPQIEAVVRGRLEWQDVA